MKSISSSLEVRRKEVHLSFSTLTYLGGTAGCIVASRVAAADPSLSILVIEGGPNNHNAENVIHPGLFLDHLAPDAHTSKTYLGKKSSAVADRNLPVATGSILGGGSSINILQYIRGSRGDFDSWNMSGWRTDDLLPYLKRIETYHGRGKKEVHGSNGPVQISRGGHFMAKTEDDFVQACARVGVPEYPDMQDLESCHGVERVSRNISPDGRRQDTAHTYLHPLLADGKHPNLHVLCEYKVKRVLLEDNKRASGVEIIPNVRFHSDTATRTIRARRLVVVSSGAIGTPAVLERSGIGAKDILDKAGVAQVVDLQGVGWGYQDHNMTMIPYRTNLNSDDTLNWLITQPELRGKALANKDPILGWNACDASLKVRPTEAEVDVLGPAFREAWDRDFRDIPNRPMILMTFVSGTLDPRAWAEGDEVVMVTTYPCYPWARGSIHITGSDAEDEVDFATGIFEGDGGQLDVKAQVWAYKKQREIMRRTRMFRGELGLGHPAFAEDSPAKTTNLIGEKTAPIEQGDVENIQYSEQDDAAIEKWLREIIGTAWHSLGTARMAPRDQHGVVDKNLNVYGVNGLKVADLSIVPANVCANTCNTAMLIGEKAAGIILEELGLRDNVLS